MKSLILTLKTLAQIVGSEEEARMKIYSVSTKHYYTFGALASEELSYKLKELPYVRWVLPDSYLDVRNKDYGAVPYDPKYHEDWVRNNSKSQERNRRNDRPRTADCSRNFERRQQPRNTGGPQGNMGGPQGNMGGLQGNMGGPQGNMGTPPNNYPGGAPSNRPPPNADYVQPPSNAGYGKNTGYVQVPLPITHVVHHRTDHHPMLVMDNHPAKPNMDRMLDMDRYPLIMLDMDRTCHPTMLVMGRTCHHKAIQDLHKMLPQITQTEGTCLLIMVV